MMLPFSPPAMRTPDGKLWSSMPRGPQTSVWYLETEQRGYYWGSKLTLKRDSSPKNENSVIIYSPSSISKPE